MYWLTRYYHNKEAIGVFEEEELSTGYVKTSQGTDWVRIDFRAEDGIYEVSKRIGEERNPTTFKIIGTIESITKAEFETYKEFGCFPKTS